MTREVATRKLDEFVKYVFKDWRGYEYILGKWHARLFDAIERIERGELKRLIIEAPPGSGKSEIISRLLPAWYLGRNPNKRVMGVSYSDSLANEASRDTRKLVSCHNFKNVFDLKLAQDKKEAAHWETSKGGVYYTFGAGGSITGKRFHLGIIDDYCKNREEAESLTYRERVWNFYTSTFYTRKFDEDAAIIVMATRWNEDDLIGRLKEAQKHGGDQWEILSFPALNQRDESFFPERFSKEYYQNERSVVGVRDFAALYQQDPIVSSGNVFRKEDFRYFNLSDLKKEDFTVAVHVDPAFSTSKDSDDVGISVTARHKHTKEIYVLEVMGEPLSQTQAYSYILSLAEKWRDWTLEFISVEEATISKEQQYFLNEFQKFLKDQGKFYTVLLFKPQGQGKKEDRIKFSLEPMFNRHSLYFRGDLKHEKDWMKLEEQLLKFPVSRRDDVVDAVSQGVIMWGQRQTYENNPHAWDLVDVV